MSSLDSNSLENLRQRVVEDLTDSYSRDFLSQDEFEERIENATAANTHADLRAIIVDLPTVEPADRDVALPAGSGSSGRSEYVAERRTLVSIFSGTERKGLWNPPRTLNTIAVFGGSDIDLRDATIPSDGMRIAAFALFGGVDIIVPDNTRVEIDGVGIFGSFAGDERTGTHDPDAPVIHVGGIAIFGAVEVTRRSRKKRRQDR